MVNAWIRIGRASGSASPAKNPSGAAARGSDPKGIEGEFGRRRISLCNDPTHLGEFARFCQNPSFHSCYLITISTRRPACLLVPADLSNLVNSVFSLRQAYRASEGSSRPQQGAQHVTFDIMASASTPLTRVTASSNAQPLMQPTGRSCATLCDMPARAQASTTFDTFL